MIRLSPSQIKAFGKEGCKRLWAWGKLAGIYSPSGAGAALGTEIHEQIENYLKGTPLNFQKESAYIISAGMEHLPKPLTDNMFLEREFFFDGKNATYNGRIDCELPGIVIDWKSTSSFGWQKTEQDLRKDPQAILYACHYFIDNPSAETVICKWVYFRTRGGRASQVTELTFTQREARDGLDAIEEIAKEMAAVTAAAPKEPEEIHKYILTLAPTETACGNYGGCPHRCRCTDLDPLNGLKSYFGATGANKEPRMSRLSQKLAGATPGATAAAAPVVAPAAINPPESALPPAPVDAPAPTPPPAPAPPPAAGKGLMARVKANLQAFATPAPAEEHDTLPPAAPTPLTDLGRATAVKYGVAPDEELTEEMVVRCNAGQPPTPFHGESPPPAAPAHPVTLAPAETPKKRGRPAGSKNKVTVEASPGTYVKQSSAEYVREDQISETVVIPKGEIVAHSKEQVLAEALDHLADALHAVAGALTPKGSLR